MQAERKTAPQVLLREEHCSGKCDQVHRECGNGRIDNRGRVANNAANAYISATLRLHQPQPCTAKARAGNAGGNSRAECMTKRGICL
jgi:hypothetical protein